MKIRRRKNSWQLDYGIVDGRRRQRSFPTREAALREMNRVLSESAPVILSGHDQRRFAVAAHRLGEVGATIEQAVEFFLAHGGMRRATLPLAEVLEGAIAAKQEQGARRHYLSQLRCSAGALIRWIRSRHGDVAAHELTPDMIGEWLSGSGWQPKTRNVYLGDLRTLLEHGRRRGALARNPAVEVPRAALDEGEIAVLSVPRCARLLVRAYRPACWGRFAGESFRDLLAYVALGLFAGIRPEELARLHWDAIDLEEGHVVIAGRHAKTRSRRVVDLAPNARAWLAVCRPEQRDSPICPPNFRKRWERLRRACGWAISEREPGQPWPHDAMRHSFASYHYALHRNELLLQTQMGHSSGGMLFRHYRALATRRQAEAFWRLSPPPSA